MALLGADRITSVPVRGDWPKRLLRTHGDAAAQLQRALLFNYCTRSACLIEDSPRQAMIMLARLGDFLPPTPWRAATAVGRRGPPSSPAFEA